MHRTTKIASLSVAMVGELTEDCDAVVLLHGFGATGLDLVGLADVLGAPNRVFVFPEAPVPLGAEYGPGARAWWPIDMMKLQLAMMTGASRDIAKEDPAELPSAKAKVLQLLSELREKGAKRIVLGGFSQGAMLSTDIALTTAVELAGLLIWSGSPLREQAWRAAPPREQLPMLMSHGENDPILPFANAEQLHTLLQGKGMTGDFIRFRGAHEIPPKAIVASQRFLDRVLARA